MGDLATKCLYGDCKLTLEFKCPNRRSVWLDSGGLKGIENWGNSGVKLIYLYEVQIHDSYNPKKKKPDGTYVPVTDLSGLTDIYLSTGVNPSNEISLLTNRICGAMYKEHAPLLQPVKEAENGWNVLEIRFMSPRFSKAGDLMKLATISVKLNGKDIYKGNGNFVGDGTPMGLMREGDNWPSKGHCQKKDTFYADKDYNQALGPLLLQEHDNKVQYRNINIDATWKPSNSSWQKNPN